MVVRGPPHIGVGEIVCGPEAVLGGARVIGGWVPKIH